jgi:hypothetical protein
MKRLLGIAIGLALVGLLPVLVACTGCNSPSGPPTPSGCTDPAPAGVVTALALGAADGTFAPEDRATRTFGGQGLSMLGFRIAVQANAPVTCIAQTTNAEGSNFVDALAVHAENGWYVTDALYVVDSASTLHVHTTAYGMTVDRTLTLGGPDAGLVTDL